MISKWAHMRSDISMQEKPRVISRKRARAKPHTAPLSAVAGTSPGASKVHHNPSTAVTCGMTLPHRTFTMGRSDPKRSLRAVVCEAAPAQF